ncbi:nucleolin-like [Dendronephthya gigantea]|uniref:nucleolin-like n=1 Tax=Dendronephthya gigantea TaxID=151771 RepID=UPI00106D9858|nr:nucleolin-like [Dendronephthya gigantea]
MPSSVTLCLLVCFTALSQGDLFRGRRHDSEIKNRKGETVHQKAGVPLAFNHAKNVFIRTGIPEVRNPEDVDMTGDSTFREEDEEMDTDEDSAVSEDDDDDDDDDQEEVSNKDSDNKKNPEESGQGYEKIGDMGSNNKDDDEDSKGSKETDSSGEDIMKESSGKKGNDKDLPNLDGEFPPTADEAKYLPKEEELTREQADRKMADIRKGYVQFTIRQRFKPELKYKESAAYKILAGNVAQDVERALRATGVVSEVLFREAKDVGGPPYRSKVQVFLKLKNVSEKRLKKIVNYGLINGMITIPGSFHAT